jgi:lysophospholipid acyltransferase (LPLAT)-like uncharacterized protein
MSTAPPSQPARIAARIAGRVFAAILHLIDWTWRRDGSARSEIEGILAGGRPVMVAFWHGKYLPLFSAMAGLRGAAFTSDTFRGGIVAEICARFGYEPCRLPYKGGLRSRAIIRDALARQQVGGFAIDGPLGPYHSIKSGAIEFASELNGVIVPVGVGVARRHIFTKRWDRLEIPMPFSRVVLLVGEPIEVPARLDERAMAETKERIRDALERLELRAESLVRASAPRVLEPLLEEMKEDRA